MDARQRCSKSALTKLHQRADSFLPPARPVVSVANLATFSLYLATFQTPLVTFFSPKATSDKSSDFLDKL